MKDEGREERRRRRRKEKKKKKEKEGRRKEEERRRKKEEGRRKKEEGRTKGGDERSHVTCFRFYFFSVNCAQGFSSALASVIVIFKKSINYIDMIWKYLLLLIFVRALMSVEAEMYRNRRLGLSIMMRSTYPVRLSA